MSIRPNYAITSYMNRLNETNGPNAHSIEVEFYWFNFFIYFQTRTYMYSKTISSNRLKEKNICINPLPTMVCAWAISRLYL